MLSGSGLIGAGGYVYWMARKPMKLGYPPGPGTIAQMIFGISESLGTTLGPGEREREHKMSMLQHISLFQEWNYFSHFPILSCSQLSHLAAGRAPCAHLFEA